MVTLQRFEYPTTLDEALSLLAAGRDTVRAIAGGTSLIFFHGRGVEALVDITRLGLDQIWAKEDGITVGACARLHAVSLSPLLRPAGTLAIAEAAAKAGPRAIRNAVTLGGNVAGYKRWSDLPAPLIALNARVAIAGPSERHLPVAELFGGHPSRLLQTGELLTHFWVPTPPPGTGSAYVKLGRTETDYGLASAAARIQLGPDGAVQDAALVLGAVGHFPIPVPWIQELLDARAWDLSLDAMQKRLAEQVQPATDMRASEAYLKQLAAVAARDALALAYTRAQAEVSHA